jgi:hypothetical protein
MAEEQEEEQHLELGRPAADDVSCWLDRGAAADGQPQESVFTASFSLPPKGCRVLIPRVRDARGAVQLHAQVQACGGEVVVTALPAEEQALVDAFRGLGVEFGPVEILQYKPPWYMQADKLAHLTAPLPFRRAQAPSAMVLYLCDHLADGAFGSHNVGAFERVLDGEAARILPGSRAAHAEKVTSLLALGARVLLTCSEHCADFDGAFPAPLYSLSLQEVKQLFAGSAVHQLTTVPRALRGGEEWQMAHTLVVTARDGSGAHFRPPSCPCCR